MKNKPMNFIKAEVYNWDGAKVYKNDLWLCVAGEKRGLLSAKEVYELYKKRFDIEQDCTSSKKNVTDNQTDRCSDI